MADEKLTHLKSLRETISAKVADLAPSRKAQIEDMWVQELLDKQSNAIVPGLALLEKLEAAFNRHSKGTEIYDENGKVVGKHWTKEQKDAKAKAAEEVEKLRKYLNEAIETGKIDDLNQFVKSRSDQGKGKKESAADPPADTD